MSYASGKYAKFVCDTCGWAFAYKQLKQHGKGIEFVVSATSQNILN